MYEEKKIHGQTEEIRVYSEKNACRQLVSVLRGCFAGGCILVLVRSQLVEPEAVCIDIMTVGGEGAGPEGAACGIQIVPAAV